MPRRISDNSILTRRTDLLTNFVGEASSYALGIDQPAFPNERDNRNKDNFHICRGGQTMDLSKMHIFEVQLQFFCQPALDQGYHRNKDNFHIRRGGQTMHLRKMPIFEVQLQFFVNPHWIKDIIECVPVKS